MVLVGPCLLVSLLVRVITLLAATVVIVVVLIESWMLVYLILKIFLVVFQFFCSSLIHVSDHGPTWPDPRLLSGWSRLLHRQTAVMVKIGWSGAGAEAPMGSRMEIGIVFALQIAKLKVQVSVSEIVPPQRTTNTTQRG